ncbi:SDR family NAD(P)-dependent oxidoreductase [Mycolicibacterium setense]|uniref:SDR family NAD(P)-dependent oxidoreductase n=1 Tax=Mycolicibacterium setense TaxID=431269 RepID=UPI00057550F3|nr:SDR family NAD(P)-dependent oxidoreductase [Mycolicibacterium setense]KHO25661.1 short-chain dehydrogenase [Mycolicibacterium setense]MCV7110486.1 SDR family NAD(P)-dependent oxidoreductase [Mycolicibacterium setense]
MKDLRTAYGQYAVVTGASSGIGEEFARQLAAAGVNVILVARRQNQLKALADELSRLHGTTNEVIALDLLNEGAVDELWRQVNDLDVGIVVANAGISSTGRMLDHSSAEELNVLTLDGAVPLQMAHRFGQDFARRRRGGIILVSSTIAASPVPYLANYAAVKAYVLSLGRALNYELKKDGVDVLVVSPGPTQTQGHQKAGIDMRGVSVMAPSQVARTSLNSLGKRAHVIPGATNNFMDLMGKYLMPRWFSVRFYGWLFHRALSHGARNAS